MNITVRVLTKQATAMLAALETQLAATGKAGAAAGAAAATSKWRTAAAGIVTFGRNLQWAGYQLSRSFTIPLVAAGAAALKYDLDNERAFANIQKVYGDTALKAKIGTKGMMQELQALRGEFIALSDTYGQSQTDVLKIAEAWAAAGVSGKALGTAVEETMKTMVVGDLDAASATKSLIAIQAQYGANTRGLVKIMNALNTTENITGATMGDLIQGFERSAGVAAQAGVDYKHLAAFIAALVPSAGTAARAGNALKTIFTDLLAPTKKASDALAQIGINVNDVGWQSLNGSQRMEVLAKKFMDLDGNQRVMISDFVAGKYQIARFNQAMADISKSFDKNGKYIGDNSKQLGYYGKALAATRKDSNNAAIAQQELQTVLASNPQKLKQMWTILKNDAGKAMAQLVPFVIQVVTMVAGLVHWFGTLSPTTQKWIGIMLIGLALLGPFLLYLSAIIRLGEIIGKTFGGLGKIFIKFFKLMAGTGATRAASEVGDAEAIATANSRAYETVAQAAVRAYAEAEAAADLAFKKQFQVARNSQIAFERAEAAKVAAAAASEAQMQTLLANMAKSEAEVAAQREAQYRASLGFVDGAYSLTAGQIIDANIAIGEAEAASAEVMAASTETALATSEAAWGSYAAVANAVLAAVATDAGVAATRVTQVFVASATGISLAFVRAGQVIDNVMRMQMIAAAADAEATVAAETAKVDAMIATLVVMRETMGSRILLSRTWTAAGMLEAASVDQVTAQLIIQMRALQALQLQYARLAQMQLTEGAAASRSTALAVIPKGSTAVEKYSGQAEGAAATAAVAGGRKVEQAAADTAAKTEGIFARSASKIGGIFRGLFGAIIPTMGAGMAGAGAEGAAGLGTLGAGAAAAGVPLAAIIGIVVLVISIFLVFRHQIVAVTKAVVSGIVWLSREIFGALKSVWNFIVDMVNGVIHAFEALPRALVTIFKGVVNIVARAAHDVYEFFQYLNPFAHHSPSLVENVNAGMDAIGKKVKNTVNDLGNTLRGVYADINGFGKAIAGLVKHQQDLQRASDIKLLSKYAPGAIGEYNKLSSDIAALTIRYNALAAAIQKQQAIVDRDQASLDRANATLTKQQAILQKLTDEQSKWQDRLNHSKDMVDQFANASIKGMKKYDDAIFKNEQAQNKLQLKMLKMEDKLGPIDDARNKVADLTAEMNGLQAIEQGLRAKGAGSDVTAVYDKQIDKVKQQVNVNQQYIDSYDKLQEALDKLQRKGQELNLEKSLKFDKLERQIEQLTNTTKTLTFKQIIEGIKKWKEREKENQKGLTDANKAVKDQQKKVDAAQKAVDRHQKTVDKDNKKLAALQDRYQKVGDAIQAAKDAISQMTDAANSVADAMDKAGSAASRAGGAIGSALGGLGGGADLASAAGKGVLGRLGGLKNQTDAIKAQTRNLLDNLKGQFKHIDLFGGIKSTFSSIGRWIKKWIWDEPAKWGDWITAHVKDLAVKLWSWIYTGLTKIPGYLAKGLGYIGRFFKNLPGEILRFASAFFRNLPAIGGKIMYWIGYGLGAALGIIARWMIGIPKIIIESIPKIAKGLLKAGIAIVVWIAKGFAWLIANAPHLLLKAGQSIISGLWRGIKLAAKLLWKWFVDFPKVVWKFLVKMPKEASKIGGDIISGLFHGLADAAKMIWKWITDFLRGFVNGFKKFLGIHSPSTLFAKIGGWIIQGLLNGILAAVKAVWTWLSNLASNVIHYVGNVAKTLYDTGKDLITGLYNGIVKRIVVVTKWFGALPDRVVKWIGNLAKTLFNKGKDLLGGLWDGITNVWNTTQKWLKNFDVLVFKTIGNLARTLFNKGKDLLGGLWDGVKNVWDNVSNWFKNLPSNIFRAIGGVTNYLSSKGRDLLNGLWNGLKNVWDNVRDWFSGLPGMIARAVGSVGNTLFDKGKSLITGLWNGIKGGISAAGGWVAHAVVDVGKALAHGIDVILGLPWKIPQITIPLPVVPDIHFGPYTVLPAIPYARGGLTLGAQFAVVGDNPGGKELMLPMESRRTVDLLSNALSQALSSGKYNSLINSAFDKLASADNMQRANSGTIVNNTVNTTNNVTMHFGDLSFPNITSGDDAEEFVEALETWATGAL